MSGKEREGELEEGELGAEDRADYEWLKARERGETELAPIDERRAAEYRVLGQALVELPVHRAPEGWDAGVLAEAKHLELAARSGAVRGRGSSPALPKVSDSFVDPFDASEVSTERERVEIAAHRTKTIIADGSKPRVLFEEVEEPPVAVAPAPPTRTHQVPRPGRGRWLAVAGVTALAAAFCLWLATNKKPGDPTGGRLAMNAQLGELDVEVEPGKARTTPDSVGAELPRVIAAGDTLHIRFTVKTERAGELRLYRDDRAVVARCATTDRDCTSGDGTGSITLRLDYERVAPGSYRIVYFEGAKLAAPGESFNGDMRSCLDCRTQMAAPMTVQ